MTTATHTHTQNISITHSHIYSDLHLSEIKASTYCTKTNTLANSVNSVVFLLGTETWWDLQDMSRPSHTFPKRCEMQLCPHRLHNAFNMPLYESSETLHKGTVPVKSLGKSNLPA